MIELIKQFTKEGWTINVNGHDDIIFKEPREKGNGWFSVGACSTKERNYIYGTS